MNPASDSGQPVPTSRKRRELWYLIVPLVTVAVLFALISHSQKEARRVAAEREQFEQLLIAENFVDAERIVVQDGGGDWAADALKRLHSAQERATAYVLAKQSLDQGNWDQAITALAALKDYKDSSSLMMQAQYGAGKAAAGAKKWREASMYLSKLPTGYEDPGSLKPLVADRVTELAYQEGLQEQAKKNFSVAERFFTEAKQAGGKAPADLDAAITKAHSLAEEAAALARLAAIRDQMKYFTTGTVQLAVGNAEFQSSLGRNLAGKNGVFVLVYASIENKGSRSEHANPVNFRLSTPDGYTVPVDTGTYGLSNHFDAVDLGKGQRTAGWLAFYVPKAETYKLFYDGFNDRASKEIAPGW